MGETTDRLAQGLAAGTALLTREGAAQADPADLAASLEIYVRVAARTSADRQAAGLEELFRKATEAWVAAGHRARARAVEGLGCDALVESAYAMVEYGDPDEQEVVEWAAALVRCALVIPWLDPPERSEVQDAVGECVSVADSHPTAFMAAAIVAAVLQEEEPVAHWPKEAAELVGFFSRLPLLAVIDGDLAVR